MADIIDRWDLNLLPEKKHTLHQFSDDKIVLFHTLKPYYVQDVSKRTQMSSMIKRMIVHNEIKAFLSRIESSNLDRAHS